MPRKKKSARTRKAQAKPASTASAPNMTKAQFVRSQPAKLTAREVADKANAAGITVTTQYVYNVRSAIAARAGRATRPRAAGNGAPATRAGNSSAEELLRAIAAELGLARAIALLEDERRSVRRLIGA